MFIALSLTHILSSVKSDMWSAGTLRSSGARISKVLKGYKHAAPPEQRQVSQVCWLICGRPVHCAPLERGFLGAEEL